MEAQIDDSVYTGAVHFVGRSDELTAAITRCAVTGADFSSMRLRRE
jgi:hypothetical protein